MSQSGPQASSHSPLTPSWLDHLAALGWRVLVTVALGVVVLWLATVLGTVTISVLVAGIIAATFAPIAGWLRGRGWSRTKTAAAVTLGAILSITAVIVLIAVAFIPFIPEVIAAIQAAVVKVQADLAASGASSTAIADAEQQLQTWLTTHISSIVATIGSVVTVAILGGILLFFLLQDGDKAWVWTIQAASDWRRERITSSGDDALQRVGGYLRGTAVLAALHAASDLVFMFLLGVPLAAPLAVLVFFGGFIPYVGGFVTTIIVLLVAYSAVGPQAAIVLFILIAITNVILNNLVRPVVYGTTVHIHPAVVLIALPAGATVAGIVGLFVAVPVVAFITAVAGALIAVIEPEQTDPGLRTGLVPGWLDRVAQWSWRLLVGAALMGFVIAVVIQVPLVVVPVVLAIVLAATFLPLVDRLLQRGWGRNRAALAITGGAFLIITAVLVATTFVLVVQLQPIVAQASAGASKVASSAPAALGGVQSATTEASGTLIKAGATVVAGSASLVIIVVLATLLTFYFLRDGSRAWAALMTRLAPWRRTDVDAAGTRAAGVLGGYMIGTGAISLFGAATQFLIMIVLGLPLALPLAVLSFFGGFIPYIGSFITTGIAFLVTVAVGSPQDIVDHGHLHDRVQHRPGQRRGPDRLRQGRQPPPGNRPDGNPGRGGAGRDHRDVPRRAVRWGRRGDLADRAARLRRRAARGRRARAPVRARYIAPGRRRPGGRPRHLAGETRGRSRFHPLWMMRSFAAGPLKSVRWARGREVREKGNQMAAPAAKKTPSWLLNGLLPIDPARVPTEIIAGCTLAALAIPEVMGYTKIAGTPVITGLYTILLPVLAFALFGLVAPPRRRRGLGDSAAIMATGLLAMGLTADSTQYVELASLAALMCAVLLVAARLLKLGFIANFLSRSVLIGFLTGVGIQVAMGQFGGLFGVSEGSGTTLEKFANALRAIPTETNVPTLIVSIAVLVTIVGLERVNKKIPGALLAVVGSIVDQLLLRPRRPRRHGPRAPCRAGCPRSACRPR